MINIICYHLHKQNLLGAPITKEYNAVLRAKNLRINPWCFLIVPGSFSPLWKWRIVPGFSQDREKLILEVEVSWIFLLFQLLPQNGGRWDEIGRHWKEKITLQIHQITRNFQNMRSYSSVYLFMLLALLAIFLSHISTEEFLLIFPDRVILPWPLCFHSLLRAALTTCTFLCNNIDSRILSLESRIW